jgi:hypothetical protein
LDVVFYNVGGLSDLKLLDVLEMVKTLRLDMVVLLNVRYSQAEVQHLKYRFSAELESRIGFMCWLWRVAALWKGLVVRLS